MAKDSLNFCRREGKGKTRFAQTVPLPFSSLQQKFKASSRAGTATPSDAWLGAQMTFFYALRSLCLCVPLRAQARAYL